MFSPLWRLSWAASGKEPIGNPFPSPSAAAGLQPPPGQESAAAGRLGLTCARPWREGRQCDLMWAPRQPFPLPCVLGWTEEWRGIGGGPRRLTLRVVPGEAASRLAQCEDHTSWSPEKAVASGAQQRCPTLWTAGPGLPRGTVVHTAGQLSDRPCRIITVQRIPVSLGERRPPPPPRVTLSACSGLPVGKILSRPRAFGVLMGGGGVGP